jgi:hypothetical protein
MDSIAIKKNRRQPFIDKKIKDHSTDPFVVKKILVAKQLINKYGLPRKLK